MRRDTTRISKCLICHFAYVIDLKPLNAELNPICYLLALLAHHFLHVSRIRVKSLTLRLLMLYIYIYIYIYIHTHSETCLNRTPYIPETWTNGK